MRIPLWAYISLGILLWIFAYGYFNHPTRNEAEVNTPTGTKTDTYCNYKNPSKIANCLMKRKQAGK